MDNKLQELTRKIYAEGVEKAEKEAEAIREKALNEAAAIMQKARDESEHIIRQAEASAMELRKNIEAELKLSANQMINSVKQRITDLIMMRSIADPVKDVFRDKEFIKRLIEILVKNWASSGMESQGITLLLPGKDHTDLGQYLESHYKQLFALGIQIRFDDSITAGFRIGPSDERFLISFTDEDFASFLKLHLRPRTNKLLYGSE